MTDFETWLHDNSDRIFRYWVYKRMFTPLEQDEKCSDQSYYEDDECYFGVIKEAIELPDGDILLGFVSPECEGTSSEGYTHYHKLSEITLDFCPGDMEYYDNDE